jgi:hypothetical protein
VSAPASLARAVDAARAELETALHLAETPEQVEEIAAEASRILARDELELIEVRRRTLEREARERPVRVQRPGSRVVRFVARAACMAIGALLLTACPVTVIDSGPCRVCRHDCDDSPDWCEECRAENCPDMGEEE